MDDWPYDDAVKLEAAVAQLTEGMDRLDPLAALMALARLAEIFPDTAAELCKIASRNGYTNKRIAGALGVPPSTLRGLKEEARA